MNLHDVTPLILTGNEAPNIGRCLDHVAWAKDVVVVDSGSTDDTLAIAGRYPNVRSFVRPFDQHSRQWEFGRTETGIQTEWILGLDADYVVTPALRDEITQLQPAPELSAYWVPFTYCVYGRPLRGCAYRPVASLFRRDACRILQDGHTHRLSVVAGRMGPTLRARMLHDDRKSISHWLASQSRYMDLEVRKLSTTPRGELSRLDRWRTKLVISPLAVPIYCLVVQRGILDGWAGWFYALQRGASELILSLKLLEQKFQFRPAREPEES